MRTFTKGLVVISGVLMSLMHGMMMLVQIFGSYEPPQKYIAFWVSFTAFWIGVQMVFPDEKGRDD